LSFRVQTPEDGQSLLRKLLLSWFSLARGAEPRWRSACAASVLLHLTTLAVVASVSVAVNSTKPAGGLTAGFAVVPEGTALITTAPLPSSNADTLGGDGLGESADAAGDLFAVSPIIESPKSNEPRVGAPAMPARPGNDWFDDADYRSDLAENVGPGSGGEGSGSGGAGKGGGTGKGRGGGEFFGIKAEAQSVVFVVDCSRSMSQPQEGEAQTRFQRLQLELLRAIAAMQDEDEFFIIFFNDRPIPMPATSLQRATKEARQHYLQWMAQARPDGETDPREALLLALRLQPDVVYFLTDGDFKKGIERDLSSLTQRRTTIHTIAFGSRDGEKLLEAVAAANRGDYRFVP
jgi:hypothetical protein